MRLAIVFLVGILGSIPAFSSPGRIRIMAVQTAKAVGPKIQNTAIRGTKAVGPLIINRAVQEKKSLQKATGEASVSSNLKGLDLNQEL